jgi:hypothetical protein
MQLTDVAALCINFMHLMYIKYENQHMLVHGFE